MLLDMGRLFELAIRTETGLPKMKDILERHIIKRGNDDLAAELDTALNVSISKDTCSLSTFFFLVFLSVAVFMSEA